MGHQYKVLGWLYVVTALLWAFLWIPFGIGYYGLPWKDLSFQRLMQALAWAHVAAGGALLGYGALHGRRWWPIAFGVALSVLSLIAMYDWIARFAWGLSRPPN